jgi:aminopeptidase N
VLHQLRWVLGTARFFELLARYRQRYAYSHATTADFQAVAEELWGGSMDWFFQPVGVRHRRTHLQLGAGQRPA